MKAEDMPPSGKDQAMAGMNMNGMDMGRSSKTPMPAANKDNGPGMAMQSMAGMMMGNDAGTVPFPQPGPNTMPLSNSDPKAAMPMHAAPVRLHLGPQVDQISQHVTERLDDPGDGLKGNGRRVLTYADLRSRYRGADGRPPTREIELHLTGNMERYIWGFNGKKFSDAKPIELKLGERVRFVLINDTMMEHPIHLHGLWSELENGHGEFNPYKHTVIVKPSERVKYLVSADTPGRWAFHCHLMYHMDAGMFRAVVVS
jgi:FtsP/CotA-like multicopper oxidase with cupredoxin domain